MVQISIEYEGDLHCTAVHGPSGKKIQTDAPVDNQGKGEAFSPTDLLSASLGTCIATIMGIYAGQHEISLVGMKITVEKQMKENPRRIGRLELKIEMPKNIELKRRKALEMAAQHCPVHQSLHPDTEVLVSFVYPD